MAKHLVALVGTKHRGDDMVALLASLPQGEPLTLMREPTNRFDANAVHVWARGEHVGYIKGSQNKQIANWMDALRRARQAPVTLEAKLAIDGGKWPMVECDI